MTCDQPTKWGGVCVRPRGHKGCHTSLYATVSGRAYVNRIGEKCFVVRCAGWLEYRTVGVFSAGPEAAAYMEEHWGPKGADGSGGANRCPKKAGA